MRVSCQLATISYCHDLTDPDAVSLPIAVLAIGKGVGAEAFWIAAVVGLDAKRLGIDPLSTALLADVPHMIRRHVDAAVKTLPPGATPGAVLRAFREALKTSIHVSAIDQPEELEAPNARSLAVALIDPSLAALESAVHQTTVGSTRAEWTPTVSPEHLMEPAPEQLFWQLPSPERGTSLHS
jgi:hypothetical protein